MKRTNYPHRVWAGCLLAFSFLFVLPAGAAQISVPLNGLSGSAEYDSNGGLSASGISGTGNSVLRGLKFSVDPLDNALFDSIVNGSSPVLATFAFTGSVNGSPSVTLTTTNTFTNPSILGDFFGGSIDGSRVLNLGSGILSGGGYNATFSDIFFNLTDKDFSGGQLSGAEGNIVATANNLPNGSANLSFSDGTGSGTFQQVSDVAEPAYIGLLGLALMGFGLIWRRKDKLPQA